MKTAKILVLACLALLIALPIGRTLAQEATPNTYGILTSTPQPDGSIYHIVQSGESLWVISAAYGVPGSEIMVLNGNSPEANEVYINQVLLIRRAKHPHPNQQFHANLYPHHTTTDSFCSQPHSHSDQNPSAHPHPNPASFNHAGHLWRQQKDWPDHGSLQWNRFGAGDRFWLLQETALVRKECRRINAS
jgi:LysM domain.